MTALLIRLLLLPVWPIPQPKINDGFSYLLVADTLFLAGLAGDKSKSLYVALL
jgi:hypothetical protein